MLADLQRWTCRTCRVCWNLKASQVACVETLGRYERGHLDVFKSCLYKLLNLVRNPWFFGNRSCLIHPSSQFSGICDPTYLFDIYTYYSLRFHHGHVLEKCDPLQNHLVDFISHRFAGYKLKKELMESNKKNIHQLLAEVAWFQIIKWLSMRNGWHSSYFSNISSPRCSLTGVLFEDHTWFKAKHGF